MGWVVIGFLTGLVPAWAWAAGAAVLLAGSFAAGAKLGSDRVNARHAAAELVRHQAEDEALAASRRLAHVAGTKFEAQRRAIEVRYVQAPAALQTALSAPAECASAPTLADVVVPRGAVDILRDAGADPGPAGSAAGEPDGAVFGRTGLAGW